MPCVGPKKFTEPVALSSTFPVNLRLPPTAPGSGFDLLALRARCKRELRGSGLTAQGCRNGVLCNLRGIPFGPHEIANCATRSKGADHKFTEPVALSSTSPVNLRLPPTALGSGFDLLALRARCKGESTGRTWLRQGLADTDLPHFAHSEIVHISTGFPRAWGQVCGSFRRAGVETVTVAAMKARLQTRTAAVVLAVRVRAARDRART